MRAYIEEYTNFMKMSHYFPTRTFWFVCCHSYPFGKVTFVSHAYFNYSYYDLDSCIIAFREYIAVFVKTSRTCRHERSVLLPPLRSLRESNFCFSHVFLAITIAMWIAFRESSRGVMPCIVVLIYVLPR